MYPCVLRFYLSYEQIVLPIENRSLDVSKIKIKQRKKNHCVIREEKEKNNNNNNNIKICTVRQLVRNVFVNRLS
jgi:hypothetical protein